MKKVVYTFISKDYDDLKEPVFLNKTWDYVCFTNDPNLKSSTWSIELVNGLEDKRLSRKYKILNPFNDYDATLYIDGTFSIVLDIDYLVLSKRDGIWLNRHPQRNCAYKEAEIVINKNLDSPEILKSQISKYEQEGFPKDYGLYRCGIMIRNPKETEELSKIWWNEIEQGSWRDQISFPYACWKTGITPNEIMHGITFNYFQQSLHKPKPLGDFEIAQFEISEFINREIAKQPKNNWIVIGNSGKDPKQIIQNNPNTHLFIKDQVLIFPRWLHDYIQVDQNNKRRWDLQFKHIVEVYQGIIRPI